jgi:hypothetical protein
MNKRLTSGLRDAVGDTVASLRAWQRQRRPQKTELGARVLHGFAAREFMYRFESLGENCEFGIVQRRCGAEPLGPLRFAIVAAENLACALEARLSDLLDPKLMEVRLSNGRYVAHNREYDITFGHSGLHDGDLGPDRALHLILRRLQLLNRKLGAILSGGEKILVFRSRVDDDALALRLGAALHRFGPNCLLWVAPTNDRNAVGLVAPLADGVLKGLIDADSDWDNPVLDTWLDLCERAYEHWRAVRPAWTGARGAQ